MVHPGLEEVAAEEIRSELKGDVKKAGQQIVVFRLDDIDKRVLRLRTTEDVFVLAWGTDELSYRAKDLESIRRWTDKVKWAQLLQIHHAIRPKPKGKPTFRLVVQMTGEHGYRRIDASKSLSRGLVGKLPESWKHAEQNAAIEIWLTIHGGTAVCGVRLSDQTMRHRTWKLEHAPASLRPTVAGAMVRLAEVRAGQTILDPMCGAGTILGEAIEQARMKRQELTVLGGDSDAHHVKFAQANLRSLGEARLQPWDARRLPLPDASVDRIVCNPPFGKQLSSPGEIGPLYRQAVREMDRVLKPGGRAVLLVADVNALRQATEAAGWKSTKRVPLRILGQRAMIVVHQKSSSAPLTKGGVS